jgi:hypothetical protein
MSCRTGPLRSATPQTKTCLRGPRFERPLRGLCILSRNDNLLWASRWSAGDLAPMTPIHSRFAYAFINRMEAEFMQ